MNFFDHFKQEAQQLKERQNSNFEDSRPTSKSETIYISKKTPNHLLRMLPSPMMLQEQTADNWTVPYRLLEWFEDRKPRSLRLAPVPDPTDPLEADIAYWQDNTTFLDDKFGKIRPKTYYAVLVARIIQDETGQYVHELDTDGRVKVYHLDLRASTYARLCEKLGNEMLAPQGAPFSFLSLEASFVVSISKAQQGETSDQVEVYPNLPLPSLVGQIEDKLEDLRVLQYKSSEVSPDYVAKLRELHGSANGGAPTGAGFQPQTQGGYQPPVQPQTGNQPPQQAFNQPLPTQQQAPVQPQAFNQPLPVQQQAPQAPVQQQQAPQAPAKPQAFSQPLPTQQQAPQAPVEAPQAPTQQQAPQAPVDAPQPPAQDVPPMGAPTPEANPQGGNADLLNSLSSILGTN